MEYLGVLRKRLRRWLGIAAIQRQIRDLEGKMAISSADLERLNAATSRIGARLASLLDQIDALGTGNDDAVRAQAQQESIQQASADLRPLIEQLEALAADATEVVPEPAPEQVPVEPGPDVAPVENLPEADAPADAPAEAPVAPTEEAPAAPTEEAQAPTAPTAPTDGTEGTVVTDPAPAPGNTDTSSVADAPSEAPADVPSEERRDNS